MSSWRSALILAHRYLGILLCVLFLLWFLSGFIITYTGGMPRLTEADRLQHLPAIDFGRVVLTPEQARIRLNTSSLPTLTTVMGIPAYRFDSSATVFADSGELLSTALVSSRQIAADFLALDAESLCRVGTVSEVDQWTIGLRNLLPLEKFEADDGLGSQVYVSQSRAVVVLHTTASDRLLAWLGAIPHWFYFLPLRSDTALWSRVVIWSASLATLMALVGLLLLGTQLRWRRLPDLVGAIPHRGLMRWHFISALLFGIFVSSWVFSGLLSMEPYNWTRQSGLGMDTDRYRGQLQSAAVFDAITSQFLWSDLQRQLDDRPIREIRFRSFREIPYVELLVSAPGSVWGHEVVRLDPGNDWRALDQMAPELIVAGLQDSVNGELLETEALHNYDNYYYGRAQAEGPAPPLPVLKASFDDPANTVLYLDLATGNPVYRSHRWERVERWLYRGLHSLDFGALYRWRPFWDIVVMLLLLGGLVVSVLGTVLAWRRLRRGQSPLQ